jgi:hypothetical protein
MTHLDPTHAIRNETSSPAPGEDQLTPAEQGTTPSTPEPVVTATAAPDDPEQEPGKAVSPEKLAANRANAKLSTGPKTEQGKEKSKFNAVKHGLTARYFSSLVKQGTAAWEEFIELRTRLYDHYEPVGFIEQLLVEKLAVEWLRYGHLLGCEQQPEVLRSGYYPQITEKLTRYQSAINRQFFQCLNELERLQSKRKAEEEKASESSD